MLAKVVFCKISLRDETYPTTSAADVRNCSPHRGVSQRGAEVPSDRIIDGESLLPVFLNPDAARGDILRANQQWTDDWSPALRIEVFPARTDTTPFDYYTGEDVRTLTSAVSDGAIEISFEALDHDGQLEIYADDVTEVVRDGESLPDDAYEYDPDRNVLPVPFSGATTVRLPGASSIF